MGGAALRQNNRRHIAVLPWGKAGRSGTFSRAELFAVTAPSEYIAPFVIGEVPRRQPVGERGAGGETLKQSPVGSAGARSWG